MFSSSPPHLCCLFPECIRSFLTYNNNIQPLRLEEKQPLQSLFWKISTLHKDTDFFLVFRGFLENLGGPLKMHTPASMVMGIVFAPLGLVLVFTAAITPQWREGQARLGMTGQGSFLRSGMKGQKMGLKSGSVESLLLLRTDGLWESCLQVEHSELKQCWPVAGTYQRDPRVRLAQGLVLTSLFLCGTGIVLACIGVRCWTDLPLRGVAATGGLLVVMAGLLSLTALGVYTHNLGRLGMTAPTQGINSPRFPNLSLRPAGSLYFGWLGSCLQVLGGSALLFSFKQPQCCTCSSCQDVAVCPACRSCPEVTSQSDTDVYEVSC